MNWCDNILGGQPATHITPDHGHMVMARLAGLPLPDLVRGWREVATTRYRDATYGTERFSEFFGSLSLRHPERGIALIEAIAADEPDDEVVALLGHHTLLGQLIVFHAMNRPDIVAGLEAAALRSARIRWILGGMYYAIRGAVEGCVRARLLALADLHAWEAWKARNRGEAPVVFAALPVRDLARAWVELKDRSAVEQERDQNYALLCEHEDDLICHAPERALGLCEEVVAIENHPRLTNLLSGSILRNLLPRQPSPMLDRIEARARGNPGFCRLLWGAWFPGLAPDVVDRLEEVCRQAA
jgi:hypothetical protein